MSRTQAANEAGLSEHQRKQAIRIGGIDEAQFNELVDSDNPPTVTALSEIGNVILPSAQPEPCQLSALFFVGNCR